MCINAPTGKWGYNPEKAKSTRIVCDPAEFYRYLVGRWEKVSVNMINQEVCLVNCEEFDEYTEHGKSNVYISAFITGYARLKLYEEALEPLGEKVLYFDTDSCIYLSPTGEHLVPINTNKELGTWANEMKDPTDWFVEFVSAGPKTYALRSLSGKNDIAKSKGFSMHFTNQTIFNFDNLKEQILHHAINDPLPKLEMHKGEMLMRRDGQFNIAVEKNRGKS
jgi:hypothetical protein